MRANPPVRVKESYSPPPPLVASGVSLRAGCVLSLVPNCLLPGNPPGCSRRCGCPGYGFCVLGVGGFGPSLMCAISSFSFSFGNKCNCSPRLLHPFRCVKKISKAFLAAGVMGESTCFSPDGLVIITTPPLRCPLPVGGCDLVRQPRSPSTGALSGCGVSPVTPGNALLAAANALSC